MSLRSTLLLVSMMACSGGDGDTDTGGGSQVQERDFSYFVFTTDAPTGDLTCDGAVSQTVDPTKQVTATFDGEILDFQQKEQVPDATVNFWLSDNINGAVDATTQADKNGAFTVDLPTCTPIAYETTTPAELEITVDTYEVHQIYGYEEDGVISGESINSVSQTTSKLIPGIIGIQWDTTAGIIAGTAYDCNEDPIGNAQVFIHDADGNLPATGEIFYFSSQDLPTDHEHATATNADNGLWVAVNVPVGHWTAEMWTYNGTDYDLRGSTELDIKAGSVNISNIYTGHSDGISYPDSCLAM